MRIAVLGAGYVGLVSGACFAEFGVNVCIVDTDPAKVEALRRGVIPIYEPGLDKLVAENHADGRLGFTTDLEEAMEGADCVFLAVGTPSRRGDGHADLRYVYAAAEGVARAAKKDGLVLVTKSTVPVGTGQKIREIVQRVRPDLTIHVASNPEFLREGNAIGDFMRPDRVVLGADSDAAFATLRRLYRPLYLIETPIVATSIETAELIKYAANAFLATKITFINEIADLCERVGADVHDVARGMGLDGRIGRKFLHPGPGYGGSCFPKDTLALALTARDAGAPIRLVEATIAVNDARKEAMADRILAALGPSPAGKSVGILGVTFKPETDDMRDAPSLVILPKLVAAGVEVTVHDPQPGQARQVLPAATRFAASPIEAATGADVVVLLTEWNEYRSLSPDRLRSAMRGETLLDLRNAWDPVAMREAGFHYSSVGRA
ncbi:UDP-glucose/GDP-mannose dehydrogenase family protein [Belnapia sp. T6]|uniref:UDP-glucose 6-dehydrogenase n=1 Tax=Belnapia mucosa TaxID=2804532 RepID=A0ABS1V5P0_9PROT|nr:UDP-glucose/GDP-mannose dehydrogenase family protein [Belnapia mucosa]MBL6456991.1 UDP-glucose/GDP-mannose dehydrogenase family protein [Belnapia mucosa]